MYRVRTTVRKVDGTQTEHLSPPMSQAAAEAWTNRSNARHKGNGVACVVVPADEAAAEMEA